jgi:Rps23 Pro-64 3,4-dihydroxylase Tpa1-like proline 4-hydroxylase
MKFINESTLDFVFETEPFKHVVIDNFIKEEYLDKLLQDMDDLTIDKSYYYGNNTIEKQKFAFNTGFDETLQELFQQLNGDEFITLLENKTGINRIIRNNLNLNGAGVHKVFNNGFLCMHTDFEGYTDDKYGLLDRRLNLLLYMNKDWKDEYFGDLCLYDKTTSKIVKKISPILNRCVIFFTPGNIHGHPKPLNIPDNISRQSITTYYYTENTTGMNLDGGDIQLVKWYHDIKDDIHL